MSFSKLSPSANLLSEIYNVGILITTNGYNDYVEQLPLPKVPTDGIDDPTLVGQIENLNEVITKHFILAKQHSDFWFKYVSDNVIDSYTYVRTYARHFTTRYEAILADSKNKNSADILEALSSLKKQAEACLNHINKAYPFVVQFKKNLKVDNANFKKDYETQKEDMTQLTAVRDKLDTKIDDLQSQVNDLNKKITKEAIDASLSSLKDGVMLMTNVATENVGGAIESGVSLAIDIFKGEINIIIMANEVVDLLHEMAPLVKQLGKEDNDLQALKNIGTTLLTVQSKGDLGWGIMDAIKKYFEGTGTYIDTLIAQVKSGDIPVFDDDKQEVLNQWNDISSKIDKVFTFKTESFKSWNYDEVKLVPLSEKDKYL